MTATALRRAIAPRESHRRLWSLTWTMAVTEWRLRFYGSFFGYLWSLGRPFALFGVIYLVFTEFASLGDDVPNYAVYILFSLVLFQFFGEITNGAVQSLVQREDLLRKVPFPRLAVPFSLALTALFNLGMTLIAVFIFAIASGVYPSWGWLELPLIIAIISHAGRADGSMIAWRICVSTDAIGLARYARWKLSGTIVATYSTGDA